MDADVDSFLKKKKKRVSKPNWEASLRLFQPLVRKLFDFLAEREQKQMALGSDFRLTALVRDGLSQDQGGKKKSASVDFTDQISAH